MIDSGAAAFLQQAHRNNWQQYLASLRPGARHGWDLCVLTAGDERQASMYRRQLDWRREAGLLPARTQFLVLPDPDGRRIGSGARRCGRCYMLERWNVGTLNVLTRNASSSSIPAAIPNGSLIVLPQASCSASAARAAGRTGIHDLRRVPHQPERAGGGIAAGRADRGGRRTAGLRSSPAPRTRSDAAA